jgi:hypothetical protein
VEGSAALPDPPAAGRFPHPAGDARRSPALGTLPAVAGRPGRAPDPHGPGDPRPDPRGEIRPRRIFAPSGRPAGSPGAGAVSRRAAARPYAPVNNKSRRRPHPGPTPADRAKGEAAERAFADWLDASVLPHLYVEQSPLTVPAPLRGEIKRPDYLVGIPGVGLVAFDVKAKTIYGREGLIFDLDEVRKLRAFARLFHLTVYFACLDPDGGPDGYWVRLDQLDAVPAVTRNGKLTLALPCGRALPVSLAEPFYAAFVAAVALA